MSKENEKKTRYKRGQNPNSRKNLVPFSTEHQPESNGRPEGSKSRSTTVKRWLEVETDFKNPISKQSEKMTVEDAMTLAMIGAVLVKQNVQAYNALKDELYGKLPNETQLTGANGGAIETKQTTVIIQGVDGKPIPDDSTDNTHS